MLEAKKSNFQIFRNTTVLGGSQIIQILLQLVRSKLVALWLGPAGIGINGIYTSTISMVASMTNFSLGTVGVKYIAELKNREKKLSYTLAAIKKLLFVTGVFGMALTVFLSPVLSLLGFGNYDFIFGFISISVVLLINQLNSFGLIVLQGFHKITYLAKANLLASFFGTCISIPIYYLMGKNGIILVFVLSSLLSLILTNYFLKKVKLSFGKISKRYFIFRSKQILKLGSAVSISSVLIMVSAYLIRIYIANRSSLFQLGLYTAGFTILNTYVNMVFSSMGTDFFPRISEVSSNKRAYNELINTQMFISLLIILPLISIFIVFTDYILSILYTHDFLLISDMLKYAIIGVMFKVYTWPAAYLIVVKAESKVFLISELVFNLYSIILNLVLFNLYQLSGLGIAYLLTYILYYIQILFITRLRYEVVFSRKLFWILLSFFILYTSYMFVNLLDLLSIQFVFGLILVFFTCIFSYIILKKDLGIDVINTIKNKINFGHE